MFQLIIFCFKQKTAYEMRISDLSSDVCSSDLRPHQPINCVDTYVHMYTRMCDRRRGVLLLAGGVRRVPAREVRRQRSQGGGRSEERRVGKECGSTCSSRWWRDRSQQKKRIYFGGSNISYTIELQSEQIV